MRMSKDDYLMSIAHIVASRGECVRRKVGCVISDEQGRILSTGFNGVAPGHIPCIDKPCEGASCLSGTGLDLCRASHAEISALVYLKEPDKAAYIHCTTAPCIHCVKAILLTNIHTIIYKEAYSADGLHLWDKCVYQFSSSGAL